MLWEGIKQSLKAGQEYGLREGIRMLGESYSRWFSGCYECKHRCYYLSCSSAHEPDLGCKVCRELQREYYYE